MHALRELQAGFAAALLGEERDVAGAIRGDGLAPDARLAIYRHHVLVSLTAVLESTYPVIARLVDPRFFHHAVDRYIRQEPPISPCLFEYGATFPEFLSRFPASRALVYLPDVARLEWALNVAHHAPDVPSIEPAALPALPAVTLHPSVTLLDSPWPIDAIWRANQPGAPDIEVDLDAGGVRLQVWRIGDDVLFRPLSPVEHALRRTIARTGRLAAALEATLTAEPGTDLPTLVRGLLDEEVLSAA